MTAETIHVHLTGKIVGRPVRIYQEVTSTNDLAMALGADGAPEGCALFAETQTKGRGRLGRHWQSRRGESLAVSILLRPTWPDRSRISLAAAVAVARTLQPLTSYPVGIKWPNDIQIDGKKIAGILCEADRNYVVIGIGLNVLQNESDFPYDLVNKAGSIAMFANQAIDRVTLAGALLNELDRIYQTLPDSFPEIIAECESRSVLLGQPIGVEMGGEKIDGIVAGFDCSGGLLMIDQSGRRHIVSAGEVTLLKVQP